MPRTLWFTRGDGEKFACEEDSAHHKMMVKEGFELDETLSDPAPKVITKETLSEMGEAIKAKIKSAKEKSSATKKGKSSATKKGKSSTKTEPVKEENPSEVKEEKSSETEQTETSTQPQ